MKNNERHGIVLAHKPSGISSHTVVQQARKLFNTRKIGHAGTLDPFATGLLVLLVGETVSIQQHFTHFDKSYRSVFKWGKTTDTLDPTGTNTHKDNNFLMPSLKNIEAVIAKKFIGTIEQIPPLYSAIKINGKRAYTIARKMSSKLADMPDIPHIPKRTVTIHDFKILSLVDDELEVAIKCSSGTYIRSIARDLARELNTYAYTDSLVRDHIGNYSLSDAIQLEHFLDNPKQKEIIQTEDFNELHKKIPGIIPLRKIIDQEPFLKGIRLNCNIEELAKAKNGNFNFSLMKHHYGVIQLALKNETLIVLNKQPGNKVKLILNLLKYREI